MDARRVKHALEIGRIVCTLQSLEIGLRMYLYKVENPHAEGPMTAIPSEGEMLPVDPITDYDQLGALIDKFNAHASANGRPTVQRENLVRLRDAIAHGRAITPHGHRNLYLFKFEKPPKDGGAVRVAYSAEMNEEWYKNSIELVSAEAQKVCLGLRALGW